MQELNPSREGAMERRNYCCHACGKYFPLPSKLKRHMQSERHKMFAGRLELLHPSDSESRANSEDPMSFQATPLQLNSAQNPEETIDFYMVKLLYLL